MWGSSEVRPSVAGLKRGQVKERILKMCEFCDRTPEQPRKMERSSLVNSLGNVANYQSKTYVDISYNVQPSFYNSVEVQNA